MTQADKARHDAVAAFGGEIRRRRLASGMTLDALSQRSGLTALYLSSVEHGRRGACLSSVLAVAKGLGVEPAELFSQWQLSPSALEAGRIVEALEPHIQIALLDIMRELRD